MEYHYFKNEDTRTALSLFNARGSETGHGDKGADREHSVSEAHAIIAPTDTTTPFLHQLDAIRRTVEKIEKRIGRELRPVFMRWFLSDPANQYSLIPSLYRCATSIIGQTPLDGSRVSLWIIYRDEPPYEEKERGIWVNPIGKVWATGYLPSTEARVNESPAPHRYDSETLTKYYLENLDMTLRKAGASLAGQCVRTWFMVRDIDVNYNGVVKGRNEVFRKIGLTETTHFIASTGINGISADRRITVAFNAYADINLTPEQIIYLKAASHMNPTAEYGVAFERATAIDYPDRREIYISGTASINNRGEILYPGDAARQTERVIENIGMLLREGEAVWEDVAHIIIYLRDIADYPIVADIFRKRFPKIPAILVLAAVCRPGWLVEAECMAIVHRHLK